MSFTKKAKIVALKYEKQITDGILNFAYIEVEFENGTWTNMIIPSQHLKSIFSFNEDLNMATVKDIEVEMGCEDGKCFYKFKRVI